MKFASLKNEGKATWGIVEDAAVMDIGSVPALNFQT